MRNTLSVLFIGMTALFLASCADLSGSIGSKENNPPYDGELFDTVLTVVKDSSYRHSKPFSANGALHFGYYRGMNAGTLFRFTNFDSIVIDTSRFDSIRVDTVSLVFNPIRQPQALLSEATLPLTLQIWQPSLYWEENVITLDSIRNYATPTGLSITMPVDTAGGTPVTIELPIDFRHTVERWIHRARLSRPDTNFGFWLLPDTSACYAIRSFYSGESIDSLKPYLKVVYSLMRNGSPQGFAITHLIRNPADISFVSPGTTPLTGLQVGSGDAVRGIAWFNTGDLINRQLNVHRATLLLPRVTSATAFGKLLALNYYMPYGDSVAWQSEPSLSTLTTKTVGVSDTTTTMEMDVSNTVAYWLRAQKTQGAFIFVDASEGDWVSRTVLGSVSNGQPAQIRVTMSRYARRQ